MRFEVVEADGAAPVVASGVLAGRVADAPEGLGEYLAGQGFEGEAGATVVVPRDGGALIVVGLGDDEAVSSATLRRAAAGVARAARRHPVVTTTLLEDAGRGDAEAAQAVAEGFALGAYAFDDYKREPEPNRIDEVRVVSHSDDVGSGLARGARVAEAVTVARDLGNEPGGTLTPTVLAERAVALAEANGLAAQVLDRTGIEAASLGGLLGVNRGSAQEPRFLRLEHLPDEPRAHVVLVGKGITFDAGGLSIKTAEGMVGMNGDMGGGAAVIAALSAVPDLVPDVHVTGLVPATDNMLGPDATRPGDVLRMADGTTVEVLNTDAEGRLILADALALARREEPDAIVDLATLTGACMVALGPRIAGLMGNDDGLVERIELAAGRAGERVWHLPLPIDLAKELESPVADLKNVGKRYGGALTAGLFLQHFVGEGVPWAHLDIAGPAWLEDPDGENPEHATGFGVRTLLELLASYA
jgi:leucyl aminopeptidase